MHSYLGAVSILLFCLSPSSAYLDGAREESCFNHSIRHRADLGGGIFQDATTATCSPCSYQLVVTRETFSNGTTRTLNISPMEEFEYSSNTTYNFELRATVNAYLGFLIQARYDDGTGVFDPSSPIVGAWDSGTEHRPLNCRESIDSSEQTTSPNSVTHKNSENFRGRTAPFSTTLRWTAPSDPPAGRITFWYTIVQQLLNDFYPVAGPIGIQIPPSEPPTEPLTYAESSTATEGGTQAVTLPTLSPPIFPTLSTQTSVFRQLIGIAVGASVGGLFLIVVPIIVILVVIFVCLSRSSNDRKENRAAFAVAYNPGVYQVKV